LGRSRLIHGEDRLSTDVCGPNWPWIGAGGSTARRRHSCTCRRTGAGWAGPQNSHQNSYLESLAGARAPWLLGNRS
jgi:hypothetical protein